MRKAVKFIGAGCALFLLVLIGFVAYLGWELRPQPPTAELPALVRNLPGPNLTDAQRAFRERVQKKFPDGISAQDLSTELQRDGFKLHRVSDAFMTESLFNASIEQSGGICLSRWMVSWHADQQGHARDIKGGYSVDCP